MKSTIVAKDLVLIGGGHAHVAVLRSLGMKPVPGLRITVISRDVHTPYSGMLPGFVAGHYSFDECHIDLSPLARFAGARLYHDVVEGLDLEGRQIRLKGRPCVHYDVLSINTGSTPELAAAKGADQYAIPVKPIDEFLRRWDRLAEKVLASNGPFRIVTVGGGAGGVELLLSVQFRLQALLREHGDRPERLKFCLLTREDSLLSSHTPAVRERFARVFRERDIDLRLNHDVTEVTADSVLAGDHNPVAADAVLWVTGASAPAWPDKAGLAVDSRGFISVDDFLQSESHSGVFAVGDVASMQNPRPKSGVFAVRQGPVLTENIRRFATGKPLQKYRPQKKFLGLISTGDQYAIASRGGWSTEGAWIWRWKDRIDRRFMQRFNDLPEMDDGEDLHIEQGVAGQDTIDALAQHAMRCGGCGAKVGSDILNRVMQRLPQAPRKDVLMGINSPDDAALLSVPTGKVMVQSVDYFRAFMDDAYTFGAIATNHALGDLYAMGAQVQSALAIATVPYGIERVVEESLYELLAGCQKVLAPSGGVLAGGHSSEGAELAFGLTVNGLLSPDAVWRKSGLQAGDQLILTKPLGTGTLFAADMRAKAKGRWVQSAIESMLLSNQSAAECLHRYDVTACTDVTGFGLLGHLLEMLKASSTSAVLWQDAVSLLDGAMQTASAGILSSLQPQNLRLRRAVINVKQASQNPAYPLLFDPQTAGGLLAGVAKQKAEACLKELQALGYTRACIIGEVRSTEGVEPDVEIK